MKSKVYTVFLFSIMFLSISIFATSIASANTIENNGSAVIINNLTEEEVELEHQKQINEEILNLKGKFTKDEITIMNDIDDYKFVYGPVVTRSFGGFAGNQPPGGTRFPTGGSFLWHDSGGPLANIIVTLGGSYGRLGISVPLGVKSNSVGLVVNAPNKTDFFKLYVSKTYQIKPYTVLKKEYDYNTHTYYWKHYYDSHTKVHLRTEASAVNAAYIITNY